MTNSDQQLRDLLERFSERPIAYHRIYAEITGSVTAGLLLSQIAYWWFGPAGKRPFYKTDEDFMSELSLGLYELKGAKEKLKNLQLITMKRRGMPAKTYYSLEETRLLEQISSCGKNHEQVVGKTHNKLGEKPTTITDNTSQTTRDKQQSFPQIGLSSKTDVPERGYHLLIQYEVAPEVAKSIIDVQHTPIESIEEAIKNGLAKQKYEVGFILTPGYIVAALNGARTEGKVIKSTKNSRRLHEEITKTKLFKRVPRPRLGPAEFQRRQQQQTEALKNSEKTLATV